MKSVASWLLAESFLPSAFQMTFVPKKDACNWSHLSLCVLHVSLLGNVSKVNKKAEETQSPEVRDDLVHKQAC